MNKMDSDIVVNYKIYLCVAGYEPEIRRVSIDKDISHNYFYLRKKLVTIFPVLKDTEFTISWKDSEGDTVRICSDEELVIALCEMKQEFKKLFVSTTSKGPSENVIHPNVVCDSCNNVIQGFRYKCIACTDYDLCPDCERSQNHPDHPMIRIPLPLSPEMPFSRRFGRDLHKMSKHLDRLFQQSERWWSDKKGQGDESSRQNSGDKKHTKGGCPISFGSKDFFDYMMRTHGGDLLEERISNGASNAQQSTGAPQTGNKPTPTVDETRKFVEILTQGLSSFLDPLGFQREGSAAEASTNTPPMNTSDAATPAPQKPPCQMTPTEPPQPQPESQPQPQFQPQTQFQPQAQFQAQFSAVPINEQHRDVGGGDTTARQVNFNITEAIPVRVGVRPGDQSPPVLDNTWTVVNEDHPPVNVPVDIAAGEPMVVEQPESPRIYPAIPVAPISATGNNVDETLRRMESMGFVDEGGWLRQLVESKQGSLEEVLRFLTPIPKPAKK